MRSGFSPKGIAHKDTNQSRNRKDDWQWRTAGVQITIGLLMDFQRELTFRFRHFIAGSRIVGHGLVFIYPQKARIGPDKSFH